MEARLGSSTRRAYLAGLALVGIVLGGAVLAAVALPRLLEPGSGEEAASPTVSPTAMAKATPWPVGTRGAASPPRPSPSGSDLETVTLVGAGDIADCGSAGDEATATLLDTIAGTVFTAGDNAYDDGTPRQFERCYDPSWGRHRDRTRPAPGNHDYNTPAAAGYYGYFGPAAGDPSEGWYAFDLGAWRIYALNSNCAAIGGCESGSAQERWLRSDLPANARACVLAYWHHPLFSSGEHGNNPAVRPLFRALYDAGAELVIGGHDHSYERFAAQAPDGAADSDRGLVEIVVGTGGRSLRGFPSIRPNSLVRNADTHGVLRLDLGATGYAFEFVPAGGRSFTDAGSGVCH